MSTQLHEPWQMLTQVLYEHKLYQRLAAQGFAGEQLASVFEVIRGYHEQEHGGWVRGALCGKPAFADGHYECAHCGRRSDHDGDLCFPVRCAR